MGCFQTKDRFSCWSTTVFLDKVKEAIDKDCRKSLELILRVLCETRKSEGAAFIDQVITEVKSYKLSPLAYSLFIGAHRSFKYLYEKGASLNAMDEILDSQGISAINVICLKGHLELLKFYLPIFLSRSNSVVLTERSFTLDFKESITNLKKNRELAMHSACRGGMIGIINYLYNFFKNKPTIPKDFDLNALDDENGESISLLACRFGNFTLVKMLNESCQADFKTLNLQKENALMVCVSGYKRNPSYCYIECVQYLVEVVEIDLTYNCEELLLVAENAEIVSYLERKLEEREIYVKKKDLEAYSPEFFAIDFEDDNSKQAVFTDEVRAYLRNERTSSMVSSISDRNFKATASTNMSFGVSH